MRVCDVCYSYIKKLLEFLNNNCKEKNDKIENLNKISIAIHKPIIIE